MSKLTASELMIWALSNLWKQGKEGGYFIWHGQQPVNDFGHPCADEPCTPKCLNFFARAFPGLFPYGEGGIEGDQEVPVDFSKHIWWSLCYYNHWFQRHQTFSFIAFGIMQRCQVLLSARLQMNWKTFERDAQLLSTLTLKKLQIVQEAEEKNIPISDPLIQLLWKHVYATGAHVLGSDYSHYQLRSQIWSTSIMLNPPSLWITINPCDLHDPIVQVFAGENINLENLWEKPGPSKERRAENMALDPYAAAKFFHFLIWTILTTLFGAEATTQCIHSHMGIIGEMIGYFGLVESQGRGTLHLHMLVWLKNTQQRIVWSQRHNTLPNFISQYFPCSDDEDQQSFYYASMFMLLKPWRNLQTDLKHPSQTWEEAFNAFCAVASPRDLHIISNIQYFHKCEAGAKHKGFKPTTTQIAPGDVLPGELELDEDVLHCKHDEEFTEDGLAYLIASSVRHGSTHRCPCTNTHTRQPRVRVVPTGLRVSTCSR